MAANPFDRQLEDQYRAQGITSVMVALDGGRRQNMKRMTCSACGRHEQVKLAVHIPPAQAARRFANAGWQIGEEPLCPDCVELKQELRSVAGELRGQIVKLEREIAGLRDLAEDLETVAQGLRERVDLLF